MKATISSKGQIVLPAEFRQMDRIEPGQEFEVERLDRGDYRLVRRVAPRNEGALDWLLACPHNVGSSVLGLSLPHLGRLVLGADRRSAPDRDSLAS